MKGFVHFEQRVLALGLAGIVAVTAFPAGGQQVWTAELPNEETSDVYQSIVTGEEMHTVVLTGEEPELYQFVPETSGLYRFYSIGEEDTYGYIYDEEQNLLAEANDGGDGLNFMLEVELEEGTTYYLQSDFFLEEEGEITSVIEAVSETDTYELPQDTFDLDEETTESEEEKREETTTETVDEENADIAQNADEQVSGDYKYTVQEDGTIKIIRYLGSATKITFPKKINGKTVTTIGEGVLIPADDDKQSTVLNITIPKTVTEIQYNAFAWNCEELKIVNFESGSQLKRIEADAFQETSIEKIVIPNSVTYMGEQCFWRCLKLKEVTLGKGLSEISTSAFAQCKALKTITIPANVKEIQWNAFYASGLTEIKIPDTVKTIQAWSFAECDKLKSVQIGNGITIIPGCAFYATPNLKNISLPDSIEEIQWNAFEESGLEQIKLPKKLKLIESSAFENTKLSEIEFPDSLKEIDIDAFRNCRNLSKVKGGKNIEYIGSGVFSGDPINNIIVGKQTVISAETYSENTALTTLKIPNTITAIQYKAFANDINLANITFTNNLKKISADAFLNTAWYKKQPNGLVYAGVVANTYKGTMPANTTLSIKSGTKGVGAGAFANQKNLVNVKLPVGLEVIDEAAFAGCESMKKIELPSSVNEIGFGAIGFKASPYRKTWNEYWKEWDYEYYDYDYFEWENEADHFGMSHIKRIPGFVIIADKGSAGEEYAKKYGITYQERTRFTIQYNLNGGKNVSGNPATYVKNGNEIILKNPTRSGCVFAGWYSDAGFKNRITKINKGSVGDKVVYAKWIVKVNKLTLNKTKATLVKDETLTLKATVTPTNAANKAVTWKSSNTKVATVTSSGKVTAKGVGTAIITCTAKDGSRKSATCKITVRKYTNTEAFVARIYTKALGRSADISGMKYWVGEINARRKTPVAVAELFITSPEFTNKKLNNKEYVKVLYRTFMGREYDQGGLDYWVGRLNKGESRKAVLESFAGCQEFKNIVKSFGL